MAFQELPYAPHLMFFLGKTGQDSVLSAPVAYPPNFLINILYTVNKYKEIKNPAKRRAIDDNETE
jgi:hypothetical protein